MFTFYFKAIKNFNSYLRFVYDPKKTINSGNINFETLDHYNNITLNLFKLRNFELEFLI